MICKEVIAGNVKRRLADCRHFWYPVPEMFGVDNYVLYSVFESFIGFLVVKKSMRGLQCKFEYILCCVRYEQGY